jgi:flagellar hook-associated protein 2
VADPVRISGFFANFDTESVITQLTNVRMQAVTKLQNQSDQANLKKAALGAVQQAVSALLSKLTALSQAKSVSGTTITSSSASVSASGSPSSQVGSFTVDVTKLATASKMTGSVISAGVDPTKSMNASNFGTVPTKGSFTISTATGGAKTFGVSGADANSSALLTSLNSEVGITNGTFTIATATGGSATITVDTATESLDDVLTAINNAGVGVTATLTDDQYGHANRITLTSSQGDITLGSGADTSTFLSATNLLAAGTGPTVTSSADFTTMMSLNDVIADINASTIGVTASITNDADGRPNLLSIASTQGNISFGNGGDTSNFLSATGLLTSATGTTRSSSTPISRMNVTKTLAAADLLGGAPAPGSHFVTINNVQVSYDAGTDTLADFINRVNSSAAGVTARYDSVTDKVLLTNSATGPLSITVADDGAGGDLGAKLGLIGATTVDGQNAEYSLDGGPAQQSSSNTIAHNGVSVTFNALTNGTPATITAAQDTAAATTAIKGFVSAFNDTLSIIDQVTKADGSKTDNQSGPLSGDASLRQLKSDLRSIVSGLGTGISGSYQTLSQIGLSFGPIGSAIGTTNTLQFDEAKFKTALAADPAGAQSLLSSLTLAATLQTGGTSSITGLTGSYSGGVAGTYSIADDGLGGLTSTFTPVDGSPAVTTFANVAANGSTTLLIPGMTLSVGALQAGTSTVTVSPSSQSVIQRLKQFAVLQAGAGGVLKKRQDTYDTVTKDLATRMDTLTERVNNEMEQLRKKFAAMEQAQANAQGIIQTLQKAAANNSNNNN